MAENTNNITGYSGLANKEDWDGVSVKTPQNIEPASEKNDMRRVLLDLKAQFQGLSESNGWMGTWKDTLKQLQADFGTRPERIAKTINSVEYALEFDANGNPIFTVGGVTIFELGAGENQYTAPQIYAATISVPAIAASGEETVQAVFSNVQASAALVEFFDGASSDTDIENGAIVTRNILLSGTNSLYFGSNLGIYDIKSSSWGKLVYDSTLLLTKKTGEARRFFTNTDERINNVGDAKITAVDENRAGDGRLIGFNSSLGTGVWELDKKVVLVSASLEVVGSDTVANFLLRNIDTTPNTAKAIKCGLYA